MSEPAAMRSANGWADDDRAVVYALNERIRRVVELHFAHTAETAQIMGDLHLVGYCRVCRMSWPCPTVEILTGAR